MAQRSATAYVVGNVVKHVVKEGSFTADDGTNRNYGFVEARVLTPEYDTLDVRFPVDNSIKLPQPDEQVTIRCEVTATQRGLKIQALAVMAEPLPV